MSLIEQLENRVLMSTTVVQNVVADNRGLINIYFSGPLFAASVNTGSVSVLLAGHDGILNTGDDVVAPTTVTYGAGQNRIVINANLPANTAYWVLVRGNAVYDASIQQIDGEYSGTLPTGDGTAGGDFAFDANVVPVNSQIAAFNIQNQRVNVRLDNNAQIGDTITNFLHYVNNGTYDGTFIHRTANQAGLQIVQGGAFFVQSNPVIGERATAAPIEQQPVFSNTIGTLAFANTGAANSTSNQWYFNVGDDSDLDGGYSVFGTITNQAGLNVVTNIDNIPSNQSMDLTSTISNGQSVYGAPSIVGQLDSVPTFKTGVVPGTVNPATDFIVVSRVAIRNVVTPIPSGSPGIVHAVAVGTGNFSTGATIAAPADIASLSAVLNSDSDKLK